MTADRGSRSGWANVPIPEPHVIGLFVGIVLHALRPWRLSRRRRITRVSGVGLVSVGVLAIEWAVRTVGETDLERPTTLVVTGPYAFNRNPMYAAWTTTSTSSTAFSSDSR